jgi:hypothetical protein
VKASAADYVAQKRQQSKDSKVENEPSTSTTTTTTTTTTKTTTTPKRFDRLRNFAYLLYGALYQGVAQEFIYNHAYPTLFGTGTDVPTVLTKVLFDLLIQTTLVTLPIAYLSKAIIFRYGPREAFRRYTDDIKNHGLLTKYFMLWGPVQCLTFRYVRRREEVLDLFCVDSFYFFPFFINVSFFFLFFIFNI